jgi:hypothetical protein
MALSAGLIKGVAAFRIAGSAVWLTAAQAPVTQKAAVPAPFPAYELVSARMQWESKGSGGRLSSDQATELIAWLYEIRDYEAVASILGRNRGLIPLLFEAYGQIISRFDSETSLRLEPFRDLEAPSYESLVAVMRVHLSPERALALLDEFDMEWWLSALPQAHHKLTFVLDYA